MEEESMDEETYQDLKNKESQMPHSFNMDAFDKGGVII